MKFLSLLVLTLVAVLCLSAVDPSKGEANHRKSSCSMSRSVHKFRGGATYIRASHSRAQSGCSGL